MDYEEITQTVKRILKNEKKIRQAIAEKRAARTKPTDGGGRAPGHISKPTEVAALQNLTPVDFIYFCAGWKREKIRLDRPEEWMACIDEVKHSLVPRERELMTQAFTAQDWEVCAELNISRITYYAVKREIISRVAVAAATKGLLGV